MKRTLWALTLVLPAVFIPLEAQSFWSRIGFYVHQDITVRALAIPFSVGEEEERTFGKNAIQALKKSVQLPDVEGKGEGKMEYNPVDHFDSERFSQSLSVMKLRRAQLVALLSADNPYAYQASAWTNLGLMFHAAQDFYAHSTWVQGSGDGDIVNFGKLTRASGASVPPWRGNATAIGEVCDSLGVALLSRSGPLTTGYFAPNAREDNAKCEHGTIAQWLSNCFSSGVRWGIALDSGCVARADLPAQRRAEELAEMETRSLVKDIIAQLREANKQEGICALLDVPLTECPIDLPACPSTAQSTEWESAFRYAIIQNDGISSNETVGVGGGRSSDAVSLDLTSGSPPRLRLRTAYGLDAFHVSLSVRTTAPYQDGVLSYQLEAPGEELWNSINPDGCLNAEFVPSSYQRRGCFQFTGTLNVVSKTPLCTRDGLLFSTLEVGYEGNSPVKPYGSTSLGPVKADRGYAKGVFMECARGSPTSTGAKGNDKFTCLP